LWKQRKVIVDRRLIRRLTPEEEERDRKRAELAGLEARLVQHELDLATMRAELFLLNQEYLRIVGSRYAELDELEAQIAEALARNNPDDPAAHDQAAAARQQARGSASETRTAAAETRRAFSPSDELKKLYRTIAKLIHPDLASDEVERARRHTAMVEANRAYESGDEIGLRAVLDAWETNPDAISGSDVAAELIRLVRKIAQVRARIIQIREEMAVLRRSDLAQLRRRRADAMETGRDLFAEMAAQVATRIDEARSRLVELERAQRAL
jgi:hypothetical protein